MVFFEQFRIGRGRVGNRVRAAVNRFPDTVIRGASCGDNRNIRIFIAYPFNDAAGIVRTRHIEDIRAAFNFSLNVFFSDTTVTTTGMSTRFLIFATMSLSISGLSTAPTAPRNSVSSARCTARSSFSSPPPTLHITGTSAVVMIA